MVQSFRVNGVAFGGIGAMTDPLWAMAAGCVPDADPWDLPRIAGEAGFSSSGMWVDPKTTWQGDALAKTRRALGETGIRLVDVEAGWLEQGDRASDDQKILIDAGLELGARNVLIVSRHPDRSAAISQFRELCEIAGDDIRVCLEFGEFTEVKTLASAQSFVADVDHPTAGILIDLMHLNRAGDALPRLPDTLFPYIQACDFWQASVDKTGMDYIIAAVDERCCLGEGEGDAGRVEKVVEAAVDVSLEIRSKPLRDAFPDPVERAKEIYRRCRRPGY